MDQLEMLWDNPAQAIDTLMPLGANLLVALALFFIGKWLAKLVAVMAEKAMLRADFDAGVASFLRKVIYVGLLVFVVVSALSQLGINTTSAAAIVGAAGLAVGLSLKDQISAFAAGVMLIIFRPFKPGDYVEVAGIGGAVEEITITHTQLRTGDNKQVIVPNNDVWTSSITNYSAKPTRRIDLVVGVSYEADLKHAREVLEAVLATEDRLLAEPAPVIAVHELADSAVNFVVRPWVNSGDYWAVRWSLTEHIKVALDDADIGIPYPQHDVYLYPQGAQSDSEAAPAQPEKT